MTAKTYDNLVNLINTVCIYLLILSLFFTLQGRSFDITTGLILETLGICSVTFLYYFARKYVNNILLFLLLHIIPTALYLIFFSSTMERYLYFAIFIVVFPLVSIALKYTSKPQKLSAMGFAPIIIIIGLYLFVSEDNSKLQSILSIITFVFVIMVIINTYLVNNYNFVTSNESAIGDSKSIRRASGRFFKLFLILTSLFCIIFSTLSSNFVFKYFKALLRKILTIIASFFVTEPKEEEIVMPTVPPNEIFEEPEGGISNTEEVSLPLNLDVPMWLIYLVAVLVVIFIVVFAAFAIVKHFKRPPSNLEDVHEFVSPFEKSQRIKAPKKKKVREGFSFLGGYDKRIRKLFKKTIQKDMNPFIKINKAHTPTQLCDSTQSALSKPDEYAKLNKLYTKARYSDEEITKEDFNKAKEICNQINV